MEIVSTRRVLRAVGGLEADLFGAEGGEWGQGVAWSRGGVGADAPLLHFGVVMG